MKRRGRALMSNGYTYASNWFDGHCEVYLGRVESAAAEDARS